MRNIIITICALALTFTLACDDGGDEGAGGMTSMGGANAMGGAEGMGGAPAARHQCDEDVDCGEGTCQRVPDVPEANRYCVRAPNRFTNQCPEGGPQVKGCCDDEDCGGQDRPGYCVAFDVGYCGGPAPPQINECRYDGCLVSADCADGTICAPAGFGGREVNHCMGATCQTDADCDARAEGECRPLGRDPSCHRPMVFVCTYADDECRSDRDCPNGQRCLASDRGVGGCQEFLPRP